MEDIIMDKIWWKESVVYQIYPRSFKDSNGDGIGDLKGIISKLDYLKNLGINIIWLSPVYQSPNDDNGYDISNYQDIMDDFGTMEDFDLLLSEAHQRNIKIIMDLVVNHTSDEHPWFVESRKSIDNPYRDYYIWREGKNGAEPNNWGSWFGGKAWEYDKNTDMYYLHIFSKKMPDLNWDNPRVRDEIYQMMTWWLDKGIDGFRMDVISLISKNTELPDGDTNGGLYGDLGPFCIHGPHVHEYLKDLNRKVLSKYDIMTVGEAIGVTLEEAKKYAGYDSQELNTVFQFEHTENLINGKYGKWSDNRVSLIELKMVFDKWQKGLEGKSWNCLFWSNHDQPRAVSRYGNDSEEYREVSAKMLGTCLHMLKGTPYIYQGEELAMTNVKFDSIRDYRDIETINKYEELVNQKGIASGEMMDYIYHVGRDNARTPMQWDDSDNAGFTAGTPWIKVNDNYKRINADRQVKDPDSVYHYYKKLIELRKKYEIIVYGDYRLYLPEDDTIYSYTRGLNNQLLLTVCSFTEKETVFKMPEIIADKKGKLLISNYTDRKFNDNGEMMLRAYEAAVFLYDDVNQD
jgi:oligo-1,6-glucosidase